MECFQNLDAGDWELNRPGFAFFSQGKRGDVLEIQLCSHVLQTQGELRSFEGGMRFQCGELVRSATRFRSSPGIRFGWR